MHINYFSPLLPAQSGISEVAEQVVPALSRYAEVTLWTDQETWSPALEQFAPIQTYTLDTIDWRQLHQADLNVYHLGNNAQYHHQIWQISQQAPGLVILHDPQLSHFCYEALKLQPGGTGRYVQAMGQRYGEAAAQLAQGLVDGETSIAELEAFSMTDWVLENAAAVMVHTQTAFKALSQQNRWMVGYQPLPFQALPIADREMPPAPPYRLVVFGYIGYNRRVEAILEALGQLPEREQFHLDIYGNLEDSETVQIRKIIQAKVSCFQLESQVAVHGFVDDDVLTQALSNAHLAINLRYPTMGEASISQLRIWRHALPSLVTQVGWYAEQPGDTVGFVRPETEIEDIKQYLQNLMQHPDRFQAMGQKGRQRLEQLHSPDAYAKAIVKFAESIKSGYQDLSAHYWLTRAVEVMAPWQVGNFEQPIFARLSAAISWLSQVER